MPLSPADPDQREIDIRFKGGGTEISNSLFISYAVGSGNGLSLPNLPAGSRPNSRTGYIIRYIRHGDGTNEAKFYRNDGGRVTELKNVWLPSNPVKTLRRTIIKHRKDGKHLITALFDTGIPFAKEFELDDDRYPPGNTQRGLQLAAKGHSLKMESRLKIDIDGWTINDVMFVSDLPVTRRKLVKTDTPGGQSGLNAVDTKELDIIADLIGSASRHVSERKYTEAAYALERIIVLSEKNFGVDHPDLAGHLNDLAVMYKIQRRHVEAESLYKRALAIREKALGSAHPDVASSLYNLALLYQSQKKHAEAEPLLMRSLSILEKEFGPDDRNIALCLNGLAELYRAQNNHEKAAAFYNRLLIIKEKELGSDHPYVADTLNNLGTIRLAQGRYAEAERLFKRALDIWERKLGSGHPSVVSGLQNLSFLYQKMGRMLESEWYAARARGVPDHGSR